MANLKAFALNIAKQIKPDDSIECIAEIIEQQIESVWPMTHQPTVGTGQRETEKGLVGNFPCECPEPYIGARRAGTPLHCERCRGLVTQRQPGPGARDESKLRELFEPLRKELFGLVALLNCSDHARTSVHNRVQSEIEQFFHVWNVGRS